jgi:protein phosphatase 1L
MEDFYEAKIDCVDGQIIGLFGVFDGKHFLLAI